MDDCCECLLGNTTNSSGNEDKSHLIGIFLAGGICLGLLCLCVFSSVKARIRRQRKALRLVGTGQSHVPARHVAMPVGASRYALTASPH